MGRFDVSDLELSQALPKTLVKPRWTVKTWEIPREKRGAHQNGVQQSRGCLGSSRWFSTIVDVTHSGPAIYVGGAIAIEEDRDLGATYVDAIFWQFSRNCTRTSVDSMAGLDSGEGCVGTRRALCRRDRSPSRRGLGRSRRDVGRGDGRAGPRRFALRRHLTRRHRDPHPSRPGRADRNSEKINGGCAERELSWYLKLITRLFISTSEFNPPTVP